MDRQGTLRRGMRVGLLMACLPSLPWAALAVAVAAVEFLRGGDTQLATQNVRYAAVLCGGSLVVGVLMGLILGGGLALTSRAVTRVWGLAVVGGLLGALVFPAEFVVVTLGTGGAYAQLLTTLLAWPVMTVVAAVHSADIVGRSRAHGWLWAPGPVQRLRRG